MRGWVPPSWPVPVVRSVWVTYEWQGDLPGPDGVEELDHWWQELALRGAALVVPGRFESPSVTFVPCRNEYLALNILMRSRGAALLFDMPLVAGPGFPLGRQIHCDDPRLTELAALDLRWEQ